MADASQDTHPHELQSDLDLLVGMVTDAKHDEQAVLRQLESLKAKLDGFVHEKGTSSGGGSAS